MIDHAARATRPPCVVESTEFGYAAFGSLSFPNKIIAETLKPIPRVNDLFAIKQSVFRS